MKTTISQQDTAGGYLDCIHCGLCLASCPTYRVLGTEMDSPRGRIYLMQALAEGHTPLTDSFVEYMFRCLDCRACETACPSGVQFGSMMEGMRSRIVAERTPNLVSRFALQHVFPYPWRFHIAARLLQLYIESGLSGFLRASGLLARWAPRYAAVEAMIPKLDFATGVYPGSLYRAVGERLGMVSFFAGCVMNSLLGDINRATVGLLLAAGYDVAVPESQVCCGALANHAGFSDTAAGMARSNLRSFSNSEAEAIVVNASGCSAMLAEYRTLIHGAEDFAAKVIDVSSFLDATPIRSRLTRRMELSVGYDDPCHLLHAQGVRRAPRDLLAAIPGVRLTEIAGADECCGSAGIYNLTHPELSMAILDRKMERVREANLDVLVTGNPGCLFQLQYGARKHGLELEVIHIAEFLYRSISAVQDSPFDNP